MVQMENGPDWGKRSTIATWTVGSIAIILAAFQYIRPPDPNNPISFDFLTKSIVMPPWMAVLISFCLVGGPLIIDRWWVKRQQPTDQKRADLQAKLDTAQAQIADLTQKTKAPAVQTKQPPPQPPAKPFAFDPKCNLLLFSWAEGLSVGIDANRKEG